MNGGAASPGCGNTAGSRLILPAIWLPSFQLRAERERA
jgi:hypothetical protein